MTRGEIEILRATTMAGDDDGVDERDDYTSHGPGPFAPPLPTSAPRHPPPPPPMPLLFFSLVLPALPLAFALLCVSILIISLVSICHGLRARILIFILQSAIHVAGCIIREQQAYQEGHDDQYG